MANPRRFLMILEGHTPESSGAVIVTEDVKIIESVAAAVTRRLCDPDISARTVGEIDLDLSEWLENGS